MQAWLGVMTTFPTTLTGRALPARACEAIEQFAQRDDRSLEARARLAIALSRVSIADGGPFGAAIFDGDGALIAAGINRVVPWNSYEFHGEVVALALAKSVYEQGYQLPASWSLVTSSAPCCMCFGRIFWSGLRELVVCARREDVESITGFDEGPLTADWQGALRSRGFVVREDVLREEARAVLHEYRGPRYQRDAT